MLGLHQHLGRYHQLRKSSNWFNEQICKSMHRDFVIESATRLGLWDRGEICVGNENELAAIFEHATFDIRRNGRSAAETFIDALYLSDSSDKALVARAFLNARYSIFVVVETEPGVGVRLRDVFDGTLYDVTDVGFGLSQKVGARLAGRLLPLEQFWMTTGCSLPVDEKLLRRIVSKLERKFPEGIAAVRADAERCSRMNSMVIEVCIASGAASTILYTDLDEPSAPRRQSLRLPGVDAPERHKVGRNELCPCGSGIKYKKCCGRVGRGSMLGHA